MLNFSNVNTEIPLLNSCCSSMKCEWSAQSEKKKKNCDNCGNAIAENGRKKKIMAAEIWGGIKKKMLRPQYFHNKS